ncbi:hypothetical protein LS71_008105 [Helicobacter jaachi]|uniref:Prokaryotic metallothionein family protein n=1 Tax=Helicobacter jaachi TaxID=1677920 RepID=A0A4U8T785_9HELI|nr:PP0621 family protein [Helicobacter jaachi]TLD95461.1 hypothetical protein LS71_008105 [Helicobacter jaachi]
MKFLLILLALLVLAYLIVRPLLKSYRKDKHDDAQTMYQCAHCGVYVSAKEAFLSNGAYFCSKECLQKGKV